MSWRSLAPALGVGLFVLCVYLLSGSSDLRHNGDTYLRYQTTQSIVDSGHIWVAHPAWTDTRMARGKGGHLYAFYAPGQTVFMIPLYLFGKAVAHLFALPQDITTLYSTRALDLILGALLAVVLFLLARSLGYSARVSVIVTLIFALATPAWPDAQSALEETQLNLFLLLSVLCAWRFVRDGLRYRPWLAASGAAAGLAIFSRYDAAIYVPIVALFPLLVALACRLPLRRIIADALWFGVGLIPWLAVVAWWDWVRFGSPFLTGLHERTFGEPFISGLGGLLVSPGKGLIWFAPVVFLLPWSARAFVRRFLALSVLFGALILIPVLFYANVLYWHGDPAWGPRYLYTALPYLVLPLGETLSRWKSYSTTLRAAFVLVTLVSLGIQLAAISVTQWRTWYRIEVMQQQQVSARHWTGQPFHWGATKYHYYWNLRQAPIFMQVDNVYQILRLDLGDSHYLFTGRPDPYVSNPADAYPINSLAFWWADTRHPLFGAHTRAVLAALLVLGALGALLAFPRLFAADATPESRSAQLGIAAAG